MNKRAVTSSAALKNRLKKRRQAKIDSKTKETKENVFRKHIEWTADEHKALMKAIKKHGPNYKLIT